MFGKSKLELRLECLEQEFKRNREDYWRLKESYWKLLDLLGIEEVKIQPGIKLVQRNKDG